MTNRVLISGATGFIGTALARRSVHAGMDVHGLVRDASATRARALEAEGVILHVVDDDADTVGEVVRRIQPDLAFHLATRFVGQHTRAEEIVAMIDANVTFGTLLVDSLADVGAPVVVTSSAYQHYEGALYRPISLYAATKQALETILAWYELDRGLRATRLVLFDSYGPNDPRGKLITRLLEIAQTGESFRMSSGTQLLALTYVDDIVDALLLAGEHLVAGANPVHRAVRTPSPVSVREIAAELERATGRTLAIEWGALPDRPHEMREPWNVAPMLEGWVPKVSLADGLKHCWDAAGGVS